MEDIHDKIDIIKRLAEAVHSEAKALREHYAEHTPKQDEPNWEFTGLRIKTIENLAKEMDRTADGMEQALHERQLEYQRDHNELYLEVMSFREEEAERKARRRAGVVPPRAIDPPTAE